MRIQGAKELWEYKEPRKYENTRSQGTTGKPLITNTSEEFIKCRLDNFSMSFILYYVNFSICEDN